MTHLQKFCAEQKFFIKKKTKNLYHFLLFIEAYLHAKNQRKVMCQS